MPYIGKAPSSGIRSRFIYTATAAQTTFTGADGNGKTLGYTDGEYVDVYLNGVLLDPADYTATSKTSVVLDSGATVSDIVEIVVYDTFSVFNGTFTGDLTVDGDTLYVDSTNNRVGIGLTTPSSALNSNTKALQIYQNTVNGAGVRLTSSSTDFEIVAGDNATFIYNTSSDPMVFGTNSSERMRLTSDGRLGLGTSSPDDVATIGAETTAYGSSLTNHTLGVRGGVLGGTAGDTTNVAYFGSESTNNNTFGLSLKSYRQSTGNDWTTAGFKLTFNVDSSDALRDNVLCINSSGYVGVGTSSPATKLAVSGGYISQTDGTRTLYLGSDGTGGLFGTTTNHYLRFITNNTERMRISGTSPALSIGKTTFGTAGQGFTVYGNTVPQCYFNKSQSGSVNGILFYHADSYVGGLNYNNTNTSLATSSDERLKDNIENSDDAGAKIDAMQVRQFDWKSTGEHQEYGFVAQELEPVFAHAVHTDKEGDYKSVDYACLVPMLVKEIQSLRQRITDLENA